MADPVTRTSPARAPARAGGGKSSFLGQPTWMWLAGAGVVLLGYLYIRSKSSSKTGTGTGKTGSGTSGGGGGGSEGAGTGWTTDTFKTWHRQHSGHTPRKA